MERRKTLGEKCAQEHQQRRFHWECFRFGFFRLFLVVVGCVCVFFSSLPLSTPNETHGGCSNTKDCTKDCLLPAGAIFFFSGKKALCDSSRRFQRFFLLCFFCSSSIPVCNVNMVFLCVCVCAGHPPDWTLNKFGDYDHLFVNSNNK